MEFQDFSAIIFFGMTLAIFAFSGALAMWSYRCGVANTKRIYRVEQASQKIASLKSEVVSLNLQLQEARNMARKPLTDEQLKTCMDANGTVCPRCGNDDVDELEFEDVNAEDSDDVYQEVTCTDCQEKWKIVFKAVEVVAVEN